MATENLNSKKQFSNAIDDIISKYSPADKKSKMSQKKTNAINAIKAFCKNHWPKPPVVPQELQQMIKSHASNTEPLDTRPDIADEIDIQITKIQTITLQTRNIGMRGFVRSSFSQISTEEDLQKLSDSIDDANDITDGVRDELDIITDYIASRRNLKGQCSKYHADLKQYQIKFKEFLVELRQQIKNQAKSLGTMSLRSSAWRNAVYSKLESLVKQLTEQHTNQFSDLMLPQKLVNDLQRTVDGLGNINQNAINVRYEKAVATLRVTQRQQKYEIQQRGFESQINEFIDRFSAGNSITRQNTFEVLTLSDLNELEKNSLDLVYAVNSQQEIDNEQSQTLQSDLLTNTSSSSSSSVPQYKSNAQNSLSVALNVLKLNIDKQFNHLSSLIEECNPSDCSSDYKPRVTSLFNLEDLVNRVKSLDDAAASFQNNHSLKSYFSDINESLLNTDQKSDLINKAEQLLKQHSDIINKQKVLAQKEELLRIKDKYQQKDWNLVISSLSDNSLGKIAALRKNLIRVNKQWINNSELAKLCTDLQKFIGQVNRTKNSEVIKAILSGLVEMKKECVQHNTMSASSGASSSNSSRTTSLIITNSNTPDGSSWNDPKTNESESNDVESNATIEDIKAKQVLEAIQANYDKYQECKNDKNRRKKYPKQFAALKEWAGYYENCFKPFIDYKGDNGKEVIFEHIIEKLANAVQGDDKTKTGVSKTCGPTTQQAIAINQVFKDNLKDKKTGKDKGNYKAIKAHRDFFSMVLKGLIWTGAILSVVGAAVLLKQGKFKAGGIRTKSHEAAHKAIEHSHKAAKNLRAKS